MDFDISLPDLRQIVRESGIDAFLITLSLLHNREVPSDELGTHRDNIRCCLRRLLGEKEIVDPVTMEEIPLENLVIEREGATHRCYYSGTVRALANNPLTRQPWSTNVRARATEQQRRDSFIVTDGQNIMTFCIPDVIDVFSNEDSVYFLTRNTLIVRGFSHDERIIELPFSANRIVNIEVMGATIHLMISSQDCIWRGTKHPFSWTFQKFHKVEWEIQSHLINNMSNDESISLSKAGENDVIAFIRCKSHRIFQRGDKTWGYISYDRHSYEIIGSVSELGRLTNWQLISFAGEIIFLEEGILYRLTLKNGRRQRINDSNLFIKDFSFANNVILILDDKNRLMKVKINDQWKLTSMTPFNDGQLAIDRLEKRRGNRNLVCTKWIIMRGQPI